MAMNKETVLGILLLLFIPALFVSSAHANNTVTITPSIADTTTKSGDPNGNYGTDTFIEAESNLQYGFVKFNLSSIPSGATIVSATLKLFDTEGQGGSSPGGNQTISVYRVDDDWTEDTLIWNTNLTIESLATDSLTYNPSLTGYHNWNVTKDVQSFVSGTPNYGWCTKISDMWVTFASKEGNVDQLPQLLVEYIEPVPELSVGASLVAIMLASTVTAIIVHNRPKYARLNE